MRRVFDLYAKLLQPLLTPVVSHFSVVQPVQYGNIGYRISVLKMSVLNLKLVILNLDWNTVQQPGVHTIS